MVSTTLLSFPPSPLIHRPSALQTLAFFYRAVLAISVVSVVGKAHLLGYTAHEVPLPLFGLGHDWACTFRGAPLPLRGHA